MEESGCNPYDHPVGYLPSSAMIPVSSDPSFFQPSAFRMRFEIILNRSDIHDLKHYPGSEADSASRYMHTYEERVQPSALQGILQKQALYTVIARRQVSTA